MQNIRRIFKRLVGLLIRPNLLLVYWLIFLANPLIAFLRYKYLVLLADIFPQINNLWIFYVIISYFFGLLFVVAFVTWTIKTLGEIHQQEYYRPIILIGLLAFIFIVGARYLLFLNSRQYENYIYFFYGIIPDNLRFMVSISTIVLIMVIFIASPARNVKKIFAFFKSRLGLNPRIKNSLALAMLTGLSFFITQTVFLAPDTDLLVKNSRASYLEKFGPQFNYIKALEKLTPNTACVIHPPKNLEWITIGNQPVVRYFLFPRTLISGATLSGQEKGGNCPEYYFAQINAGEGGTNWPTINTRDRDIVFDGKTRLKYTSLETIGNSEGISVYSTRF